MTPRGAPRGAAQDTAQGSRRGAVSGGRLTLVTGGVRSGKSAFAERYAAARAQRTAGPPGSVVYVATARVWDDEMAARVARHQASRPPDWRTIEAPLDLAAATATGGPADGSTVVLVDSVDFWVSNRLLDANPVSSADERQLDRSKMDALQAALLEEVATLVAGWRAGGGDLILVTLEAGLGVVPPHPLGRAFRDLLGWVNAALAAEAERVYLLVAGLPVDVKRLSALTAAQEAEEDGPWHDDR